jgi:hypothetical protein
MGLDISLQEERIVDVYESNITHNLTKMAREAGIYQVLWRPEEIDITKANHLIAPLENAITDMEKRPFHYEKYNSENGWGTYADFLPWLRRLLEACKEFPDATIEASR